MSEEPVAKFDYKKRFEKFPEKLLTVPWQVGFGYEEPAGCTCPNHQEPETFAITAVVPKEKPTDPPPVVIMVGKDDWGVSYGIRGRVVAEHIVMLHNAYVERHHR